MSLFLVVLILLCATDELWAFETCCSGLGCYSDELRYLGFPRPQCPEEMGVHMNVYTRRNSNMGETITRDTIPPSFNGKVMTWFIVHGWLQNENYTWMHTMKDAALAQGDYNVIIVGWKAGAADLYYPQSAANTRTVGAEIALVANNTINNGMSSKDMMYCIGHSLGAHCCGHAGQKGGLFGRITGLDPAGPMFALRGGSVGLNPSSAELVDVIHTDGFGLGMLETTGHIDFYPNSGFGQPGCINDSLSRLYDWEHFTVLNSNTDTSSLQMIIGCSHVRAYEFFIESIRTPCFLSRHRCDYQYQIMLPIMCTKTNSPVQSMGFNATAYPARGIFYLKTNGRTPFCLG